MKVGVSGHQKREGIDWEWVELEVAACLRSLRSVEAAYSSLAAGADQVFANAALLLGIPVVAVIPVQSYERFFDHNSLPEFQRLLKHCAVVNLQLSGDPEAAFLAAGKYIVDQAEVLIAVWDGEASEGLGGTADVVRYAIYRNRQIIHINPIAQTIERLS